MSVYTAKSKQIHQSAYKNIQVRGSWRRSLDESCKSPYAHTGRWRSGAREWLVYLRLPSSSWGAILESFNLGRWHLTLADGGRLSSGSCGVAGTHMAEGKSVLLVRPRVRVREIGDDGGESDSTASSSPRTPPVQAGGWSELIVNLPWTFHVRSMVR